MMVQFYVYLDARDKIKAIDVGDNASCGNEVNKLIAVAEGTPDKTFIQSRCPNYVTTEDAALKYARRVNFGKPLCDKPVREPHYASRMVQRPSGGILQILGF